MALCGKCGATFDDSQAACPACGSPAGVSGQQAPPPYQAPPQGYQAPPQGGYQAPPQQGAYVSPEMDAQNNKTMAIIAYIWFFIPLLAAKESPFARYHANQGLILLIATVGGSIVLSILATILIFILPILGLLIWLIFGALYIGMVVLIIMGMMSAAKGEMKPLPLIGKFTLIK